MTAAVEAQGLAKTFGETTALDGVDLQVAEGSVLGLLGPNGAGKTTVVRILATLLRPDAGRGSVAGCDVRDDPAGVRAAIGLTGQYAAIDEYLTGRENLIMAAELSQMSGRESRCRADELLGQFDLEEAADRRAGEYSGGMARRLDLAVSLVARPPVLFLDEPTTGLDPRSRRGMWQVIRGLVDEGTTLLLTTQYLDEADALADRIALIDRGRLIAEGTADELKAGVGGDVLHVRTADASQAQAAVYAVRDVSEEAEVGDGAGADEGWIQVPFGDDASLVAAAVRRLDDAGIALATVEVRRPTLDQVFFALTEESGERAEAPHAESDDEERTAGGQGRAGANGGARASHGDGVPEREKEPDGEGAPGGRAVDERDAPRAASQARSPEARRGRGNAPRDAFIIARRNIRHLIRQPQLLVFVTVQPIMLVLLFNFVFGGAIGRAIESPGVAYIDYLLPGILLQAVAFGTTTTAVGMAEDLSKASSTASARCRWPGRPCSPGARRPTPCGLPSWSCS